MWPRLRQFRLWLPDAWRELLELRLLLPKQRRERGPRRRSDWLLKMLSLLLHQTRTRLREFLLMFR